MIHVTVFDPTGSRLKIQFDPGEAGVASLIAIAYDLRRELIERSLRHSASFPCRCDECLWTAQMEERLKGFFVKGL